MKNNRRIPLELYVHIPFCVRKCQYCDFLSGPADQKTQEQYTDALKEIRAAEHTEDYEIVSVFIGGGTPSALKAEAIASIMRTLQEQFFFCEDAEVTIEANPGTVDLEKLTIYRNVGINRLSLGLQSTDAEELKLLGRIHSYEEFLKSYEWARKAGFSNINIDLMFAIPGQTGEAWRQHLYQVAELNPEHISAYSLIIEEGTPFSRKKLDLPDEDTEYRMYEDVAAVLKEYGYHQYEISNYAKAGCECRHNEGYWQRKDYLGLGLGAASLLGKERFSNTSDMQEYLKNSSAPEKIRKNRELLTREDEMAEFMFLGLRMTKGISKADFQRCFGCTIESVYGEVLEKYEKQGLLLEESGRIFLSREGIHVSNAVMADFLL